MNVNLKKSIDRAIALMGTPRDYENYVCIKIKPSRGGCCCFHCWPETWAVINKYIHPCGPLEDEGDVLISRNDERFVLECHESGPEIVLYIGLGTASILLVKSVVDLIVTLLKARQGESCRHRYSGNLKITWRRQTKGEVEEEEILEIDFPLSDEMIKRLNDDVTNAIEQKGR